MPDYLAAFIIAAVVAWVYRWPLWAEAVLTFLAALSLLVEGAVPTSGEARPDPKARTLARGPRRYRRKVASPKQWQAIMADKIGPCRVCCDPGHNGSQFGKIQLHHVVARDHFGDDVADNIVPLCLECHAKVTGRARLACRELLECLTDAEYAYAIQRGGEGFFERAYGVRYER